MNPRFSILALLGVTAYFGLAIAGLVFPATIWNATGFYAWLTILAVLAVMASTSAQPRSMFAATTLAFTMIYATAAMVQSLEGTGYFLEQLDNPEDTTSLWMPHDSIVLLLPLFSQHGFCEDFPDFHTWNSAILRWSICNTSLAIGLFGGSLTLWRYRVLERWGSLR